VNFDTLLDVFATRYMSAAVYGVAVAIALLASLVPDAGAARRLSLAPISPLWLVVPALGAAGLIVTRRTDLLSFTVSGNSLPLLFLVQLLVSGWVLWGYRRFPWLVFPLAVVLLWIQWAFFLRAAAGS
jgi:hypothetical protein